MIWSKTAIDNNAENTSMYFYRYNFSFYACCIIANLFKYLILMLSHSLMTWQMTAPFNSVSTNVVV